MQYDWKLFKWNNGVDRTEFSEYVVAPIFLELRCNEQLKTGEVILDTMPTKDYLKPFPPKTKFTLERWVSGQLDKYYDYVVDHDDVEHYEGCSDICCHRIHLIDPAVFAQGLHCDNFSLTYELQDVSLNYRTVVSSTDKAVITAPDVPGFGHKYPNLTDWTLGETSDAVQGVGPSWYRRGAGDYTEEYTHSFIYRWAELGSMKSAFIKNLNGLKTHDICFTMPKLECCWNNGSFPEVLFECPVQCSIVRYILKNGIVNKDTGVEVKSHLYNPTNVQNRNDRVMYNKNGRVGLRTTKDIKYEEFSSGYSNPYAVKIFRESEIEDFPAMININNASSSKEVSFETTPLTMQDFANGLSYRYDVSLVINPYKEGAVISQFTKNIKVSLTKRTFLRDYQTFEVITTNFVQPKLSSIAATATFNCCNMLEDMPSNPFLIKGDKYNCFDLFRKAMLTCDTQIFNNAELGLDEKYDENYNDIGIQYPIAVHTDWIQRLKETILHETVFENKNLWEVIQQIGYYIHAVPYLEFERKGRERFVLNFRQLGGTKTKNNDSNKITVFNSQTLDNYFTQYDAYTTNLFSPQNEIDEWLACKTSDSNYLISNETAELHTKYNITELMEFDIFYNGEKKSALEFVFEKSVYDILSAKTDFIPAKWSALFFQMGTSKILGLNYVPPTVNNDGYMALKTIVAKLFSVGNAVMDLKFNNLKFHVRYKTQDALRITQIRPDIERFMKSSEFEKYPHHEQFYGQQDKIVDSERFSANLWGQLIRVANGIYQCQEQIEYGQEKEPGDLVTIYGENYYVTECENECYAEAIFQKVTYSKNFNQLSQIVTIPSEPRFYEISERSMIRREVRLLDFIKLSTKENSNASAPKFINPNKWHNFIRNLFFADKQGEGVDDNGNAQLPNFAYTNYKGDIRRRHYNLPSNDIDAMFPKSSAGIDEKDGVYQPNPSSSNTAVIVPLLHFPMRNAIVLEWDMDDNFKAADCIDATIIGNNKAKGATNFVDGAYYALQPVRYCDVYGRADLFDFKLFHKDDWKDEQIQRLPFAEANDFKPTQEESLILIPEDLAIGLDKDNREALSFNYQLNLLHDTHEEDNEDFMIFSNLFGKKNDRLKMALLRNEVSMFDEFVAINERTAVDDNILFEFINLANSIRIDIKTPDNIELSEVKSIVLYDAKNKDKYAIIAKNVAKLSNDKKLQSWCIYPVC